MHGLCTVTYSCCTECQILNQTQNAQTVFSRNIFYAAQIFLDYRSKFLVTEVFLGRSCYHQTACDILCQTNNFIRIAGNILLADIGQQKVNQVSAGLGRESFCGTGNTAAVQSLIQVDHLNQFILDMGCAVCTIIVCCYRCRTNQNVAHSNLTAAV